MALVEIAVDDYNVGLVTLSSPETRNALSPPMKEELLAALQRLDADPEVRCIVIAGSDKIFAAGADIRSLAAHPIDAPPEAERAAFWTGLGDIETPLLAAVSGYALGAGCELAMACDLIVADEKARFGLPEVTLGIIPGGGGTQRLTRAIGKHRAMEYVLTGRHFNAQMATGWGLVNKAIQKGAWLVEAIELARTVAERAPIATRLAKRAVLAADEAGLGVGLDVERDLFDQVMATEDRIEGTTAFLEKREPDFKGK
ncbi:MAG TPA: enoyl-CoA hydratase-related protein [Solirubrobacterales bacterium]|jgi:enoyl-CoA hydratase/carnithine racemase|nr:enoyl-CoA hydratase-related protein [Solirubrobacterales bacterium]